MPSRTTSKGRVTLRQVAEACGLSKATLYHYYTDKDALVASIAQGHVARLQEIVREALALEGLTPDERMRHMIRQLVDEYANAQNAHRVLTEDVRFLQPEVRERVLDQEREVVAGFAQVIGTLRPDLKAAALSKPLTMLLFGMINWMFTWMKADGVLDYDDMAPIVADLFLGGLPAVKAPAAVTADVG